MKKTNIEALLRRPYARVLIPNDNGVFTAEILEFPGCIAEGTSPNEAMENLERAAKSWLKGCLEHNKEIPDPASDYEHSGRIALRLPTGLHRQASQMAQREGTSLNQFLISAIAARVGAADVFARMIEQFKTIATNYALTVQALCRAHTSFSRQEALMVSRNTFTISGSSTALIPRKLEARHGR